MLNFGEAFQGEEHQSFKWVNGSRAALLIHGFPGTPAEMRPIAEILFKEGWTVQAPLLPGLGIEIDKLAEKTHEEWLEAVRIVFEELAAEHETVVVIGYSMGAALAICLAKEYAIEGLILFAPFMEIQNILWNALPLIKLVAPRIKIFRMMKPDFSDPQTRAGILQFMPNIDLDDEQVQEAILNFEVPVKMFNEIRLIGQRAQKTISQITAPTLIIQGSLDELVKPEITRKFWGRFATDVQYLEVESTHEIMKVEPQLWSQITDTVLNFTREIEA